MNLKVKATGMIAQLFRNTENFEVSRYHCCASCTNWKMVQSTQAQSLLRLMCKGCMHVVHMTLHKACCLSLLWCGWVANNQNPALVSLLWSLFNTSPCQAGTILLSVSTSLSVAVKVVCVCFSALQPCGHCLMSKTTRHSNLRNQNFRQTHTSHAVTHSHHWF